MVYVVKAEYILLLLSSVEDAYRGQRYPAGQPGGVEVREAQHHLPS